MKVRINTAVAILTIFLLPWQSSGAAQTESVEDWVRQCEESGEFSGRCFVRQSLTLKSTGAMLFEIAAGYPLGGDYPLLLLSAPLGTYLPAGITIEVDDTGAYQAVLAYCNTQGCHAYYRMTQELYHLFRSGRWLNVSFLDGTRRIHRFQVSLNGFSAGIDSVTGR
jgi:invasion protein IalB